MGIKIKEDGSTSGSSGNSSSLSRASSSILIPPDGGFVTISRPTRQANILIWGEEKTGKTTFVTRYAPCPVRVISLDGRAEDACFEATEMGRDVKLVNLFMSDEIKSLSSREEVKSEAQTLLSRIRKTFRIVIEQSLRGEARTIFLDTLKEYAEICKLAFDGTMEKTKEHSHGEDKDFANRQIWDLANMARKSKSAHLIFSARATEVWKDQKPTGRFKPQCPKAAIAACDWAGHIRHKTAFGKPKAEFEIEVTSAGTNAEELCEVYDADDWEKIGGPFVYACIQNYRDSIPSDWK